MKPNAALFESPRAWLYRLEEEEDEKSSLLNPWEKQLVAEVCCQFKKEIDTKDFSPLDDASDIWQKISIIEDNLVAIARQLKTNGRAKQHFVLKYPEWRKLRQLSVESLETIGNSIHKDRKNCNISRLVGNCTSFVGGGVCIASVALIPFTAGLSTPLAIAGGMTTVLGSATSIGASVAELTLLKKKVQEACAILEEDRTAFEVLKDWLNSASDLSRVVNSIMEFDVNKNMEYILQCIRKFLVIVKSTFDELRRHTMIQNLVKNLLKCFSNDPSFLTIIPCLMGLLFVLALLLDKAVFSDTKTWETTANRFSSVASVSLGILGPAAATFIKSDVAVAQSVAKAVAARGIVAVIGMSLDAASIVLTSIDVHKGSISEEGLKIIDTAHKMKEEADLLDRVHREMLEL